MSGVATITGLRPVAERITGAATLGRMVLSASERGEDVAFRVPSRDGFRSVSYRQYGRHAREIARGLIALGIEAGEVVALLCSTRVEWTLCEAGGLCAGAVVAPIYHTNSPQECRHVLAHSEARVVFCENAEQAAKIAQVRERCPQLEHVIVIEGEAPDAMTLAQLRRGGQDVDVEEVEARVRAVEPGDVATLVYTSGTTGPPKGCALTHSNFLSATAMYRGELKLDEVQPVIYMFLPLAHVLARVAQTVVLDIGGTLVYWSGDPGRIIEEVAQSRPTHFVAVPRIYEKLHTGVVSAVASRGRLAGALFAWALEVGRRARRVQRSGSTLGQLSALRLRLADQLGLAQVRALFGPDLTMALVGAAPIDPGLLEFFDACGVPVLEGYGLTES
ncbi:MAG TPA: AMP-binding protein, partial [Solirubrobacteraceae bacterium]|nr:AMP-binding protein [Solirubrobacteraceae bacterium]